jgi:ParB/RepB/Spo0J family partition protein
MSMGAEGLHQPIGVRGPMPDGRYEIMWGHRRWLAAQALGWPEIRARVHPAETDPLLARASENLQREQLTPLEEAHLCGELTAAGLSPHQVARRLRRSLAWVESRLQVLAAPADIQAAIHAREIPLGVAYALAAIDHDGYRRELIAQAVRLGATIPVAQVWVAEFARDRDQLISSHEGVEEIIRRARDVQALTDCMGCQGRVPWVEIEQLRLCPTCYKTILAAVAEESGPAAATTP